MSIKPSVLYHASSNRILRTVEPRDITTSSEDLGKVVFATSSLTNALMFLVPCDDSWSQLGNFRHIDEKTGKETNIKFAVYGDREKFLELDKGGAVYTLNPEGFSEVVLDSKHTGEWINKHPVRPTGKQIYESGLKAMLEVGIQVYLLSPEEWTEYKASGDIYEYLRKKKSENEKLERNYIPFPKD